MKNLKEVKNEIMEHIINDEIEKIKSELIQRIEYLQEALDRVEDVIETDFDTRSINSLGVCQNTATRIDQLCALLNQAYENKRQIERVFNYYAKTK